MRRLSKSKILVTGAGGFIGSHLCELCQTEGADVRAFVHYNSRNDWGMLEDLDKKALKNIEIVTGDLRDSGAVRKAVRGCHRVFHLGALIGIPYSYLNPEDVIQTNVLGTLHILQASLDSGVDRLVQTSTSEVYGTAKYVPMDEKHPLNPRSPYAASKVAGDKLAESFYLTYSLPVVILRPFNTYGPRQSARAVIPTIITQALTQDVVYLGNLDASRDLTYISDTVNGYMSAGQLTGIEGETVNLGTGVEVSVGELAKSIISLIGKPVDVQIDEARLRPKKSEVERLLSDNRLAAQRLGWKPSITLGDGLKLTIDWIRSHLEIYQLGEYQL